MQKQAAPRVAVFMIDGFDIDYFDGTDMPVMRQMAQEGFFKTGSCIFPSLTNANNVSIACGCWPDRHGVTTNCYYDPATDRGVFLEDAVFLTAPPYLSALQKPASRPCC